MSSPQLGSVLGTELVFKPIKTVLVSPNIDYVEGKVSGFSYGTKSTFLNTTTSSIILDSNSDINEIVVTNSTMDLNQITINDVENPTLNAGPIVEENPDLTKSISFTNGFTVDSTTNQTSVDVIIPDGIQITGTSDWDGKISLPESQPIDSVNMTGVEITSVTEIGSTDSSLSLDPPIQLVFENKTGEDVFVTTGDNTTAIDTTCSGNYLENNIALPEGTECVIDRKSTRLNSSH